MGGLTNETIDLLAMSGVHVLVHRFTPSPAYNSPPPPLARGKKLTGVLASCYHEEQQPPCKPRATPGLVPPMGYLPEYTENKMCFVTDMKIN